MTLTAALWLCFCFSFSHVFREKRACLQAQVLACDVDGDELRPGFCSASNSLGQAAQIASAFCPLFLKYE